jgi:hypothetical protein
MIETKNQEKDSNRIRPGLQEGRAPFPFDGFDNTTAKPIK